MLTRCPTCTTTFRITPEQLKARLGRVRCGQCQAVFNALDALVEESSALAPGLAGSNVAPPPSLPEPSPPVAAEPEEDVLEEDADPPEPLPLTEDLAELATEINAAQTLEISEEETVAPAVGNGGDGTPADESEAILSPSLEEVAEEADPVSSLVETPLDPAPLSLETAFDELSTAVEPEPAAAEEEDSTKPQPDDASLDFVSEETAALPPPVAVDALPDQASDPVAKQDSVPAETEQDPELTPEQAPPPMAAPDPLLHAIPRIPRRWPWLLGSVFSLLALVLQLTLHYRVELATLKPALKPALQSLCQPLGCTVPLPNRIDLLSIESSDLHPTPRKGQLQLVAVLKNTAPFAQELPSLEITLTDVADRVLIVKSLTPADYLPKDTPADAGFPARKEINLNLSLDVGDTPAAGYRLYLYHP